MLNEITDIKKNEVIGICEHCKRANPSGKCRRCEYIVNKFLCHKVEQYEDRQSRFKSWITKVNQLLHSILESENVCKHKLYEESSTLELEKLLQELKSPLEMRQPDITFFPTESGPFSSMTQSKEMLEELLFKLKSESLRRRSSDDSLFVTPSKIATSCVCKYFMGKNIEERPSIEVFPQETMAVKLKSDLEPRSDVSRESVSKTVALDKAQSKDQKVKDTPSKEKAKTKSSKEKTPGKENVSPDEESEKTIKAGKTPKPKLSPEEQLMLKMMKERAKEKKKKEKAVKKEKAKQFAKVDSLPQLQTREVIEVVEAKSESVVECDHDDGLPAMMIKGVKVVHFDPHYKDKTPDPRRPLLFTIIDNCPEPEVQKPPTVSTTTTTTTVDKMKKSKSKNEGVINKFLMKAVFLRL